MLRIRTENFVLITEKEEKKEDEETVKAFLINESQFAERALL